MKYCIIDLRFPFSNKDSPKTRETLNPISYSPATSNIAKLQEPWTAELFLPHFFSFSLLPCFSKPFARVTNKFTNAVYASFKRSTSSASFLLSTVLGLHVSMSFKYVHIAEAAQKAGQPALEVNCLRKMALWL